MEGRLGLSEVGAVFWLLLSRVWEQSGAQSGGAVGPCCVASLCICIVLSLCDVLYCIVLDECGGLHLSWVSVGLGGNMLR